MDKFLSTPSARRATTGIQITGSGEDISIHALREEGDSPATLNALVHELFLSTPSARRATLTCLHRSGAAHNFYPRPPRGGRRSSRNSPRCFRAYFYPRPPRGGRPAGRTSFWADLVFLSTPSARRATAVAGPARYNAKFLSTPSARRATPTIQRSRCVATISIHALREEGDRLRLVLPSRFCDFYPRPPRGGRQPGCRPRCRFSKISIHALREEGDESQHHTVAFPLDFYPRPPRGGRPAGFQQIAVFCGISIHALREEGDAQ